MKFELERLTYYSDDEILGEMQRVSSELGNTPLTRRAFSERSKVHDSTVRRRFGGWRNALRAAGLEDQWAGSHGHGVSPEILLAEIRRVASLLNTDSLTKKDFNANSEYHAGAALSRFGSWANAIRKAGLKQSKLARRYSDEECFENLLEVWKHYGRPPKYREMGEAPSVIRGKAYLRFGSWSEALQAFVERINSDEAASDENEDKVLCGNPAQPRLRAKSSTPQSSETRDIRIGLRFFILHRDNFKCQLCGNSPATDPRCVLHVDHILPFSRGGKTIAENLRTLCANCNIGRSNKYIE